MDKLDIIFNKQKEFQKKMNIFKLIKNEKDKQLYINQNILAIMEEVIEALRKTPYKNPNYVKFGWKKNQLWDIEKFKIEIIDIFHFLINLCLIVNISSEDFFNIFCEKNNINTERQKNNY
jgi:NTP pyrophosphatase (non-canonical NTP hydrolase)